MNTKTQTTALALPGNFLRNFSQRQRGALREPTVGGRIALSRNHAVSRTTKYYAIRDQFMLYMVELVLFETVSEVPIHVRTGSQGRAAAA
jgi:hypothetical protein